jgi:2-phospho-L-lactate guanylyltransferase
VSVTAIIPQKRLADAKSRLASVVAPEARAALSRRLLARVCGAVRAVPAVEALTIVTPDPAVREWARRRGYETVVDPEQGLNPALAHALRLPRCEGRAILILAADLPWVRPSDVAALVSAGRAGRLVLAPSKDGMGTGALLVPADVRFGPAFGTGSRAAHRRAAERLGLEVIELLRPGLACDLDGPEDLAALDAG